MIITGAGEVSPGLNSLRIDLGVDNLDVQTLLSKESRLQGIHRSLHVTCMPATITHSKLYVMIKLLQLKFTLTYRRHLTILRSAKNDASALQVCGSLSSRDSRLETLSYFTEPKNPSSSTSRSNVASMNSAAFLSLNSGTEHRLRHIRGKRN